MIEYLNGSEDGFFSRGYETWWLFTMLVANFLASAFWIELCPWNVSVNTSKRHSKQNLKSPKHDGS